MDFRVNKMKIIMLMGYSLYPLHHSVLGHEIYPMYCAFIILNHWDFLLFLWLLPTQSFFHVNENFQKKTHIPTSRHFTSLSTKESSPIEEAWNNTYSFKALFNLPASLESFQGGWDSDQGEERTGSNVNQACLTYQALCQAFNNVIWVNSHFY